MTSFRFEPAASGSVAPCRPPCHGRVVVMDGGHGTCDVCGCRLPVRTVTTPDGITLPYVPEVRHLGFPTYDDEDV